MPIQFRCPNCSQTLTAPDEAAGQSGKCRFCGATVKAPAAPDESATLIQSGTPPPPPPAPGMTSGYGTPPSGGYGTTPPGEPYATPGAPPPPSGGYAGPAPGYPGAAPGGYPGGYAGTAAAYSAPNVYSTGVNPGAIVGEAWQFIWNNALILIGAAIIIAVFSGLQDAIRSVLERTGSTGLVTIYTLVTTVLLIPLQFGLWYVSHDIVMGGSGNIGLIFAPYQRIGTWIGLWFLMMLASIPATALAMWGFALRFGIGSFYFKNALTNTRTPYPITPGGPMVGSNPALGTLVLLLAAVLAAIIFSCLFIAPVEVVDRGAGAIEAIRNSWKAVSQNWLAVFGTMILIALASASGIVLCCVGLLLTLHFFQVGSIILYRQLRGLEGNV